MFKTSSSAALTASFLFALSALLTACGGSQPPAESPEAAPAAPAAPAAESGSSSDGEHTMPDGTKMEGDSHGSEDSKEKP